MSSEEILKRLVRIMADSSGATLDANQVAMTDSIESFGVDSLVKIDLIFDIEQEFGVKLSAEELAGMKTAGDLVNHLATRLKR